MHCCDICGKNHKTYRCKDATCRGCGVKGHWQGECDEDPMCYNCFEKHLNRDCPHLPPGHEWGDSDSDLDMQEPAGQEPAGVDVPVPDSPSAEAMSDPGPSHLIPSESVPDEAVLAAPLDVAPSSPAAPPPPFPDLDCHQGSGLPPEQPQPLSDPSSASASYSSSPARPRQGRGLGNPY